MKLGLHTPIPDAVDLELESKASAVDDHLKGEVEVVELDATSSREAGKQGARDGVEIRRQRTHVHEVAAVGPRAARRSRTRLSRPSRRGIGPGGSCVCSGTRWVIRGRWLRPVVGEKRETSG